MLEDNIVWVFVDYYGFMEMLRDFYEVSSEESKSEIYFALFRVKIKE
jgi:hypothetical protein